MVGRLMVLGWYPCLSDHIIQSCAAFASGGESHHE